MTTEEYIEKYKSVAIAEMHRTRIPASITLAQGILESGSGNSRLAAEAKNHFGIKCKKDWTGPSIREDDDAPQECFRAYATVEESYRDHSEFLLKSSRYAFLFDLHPHDYKGWAEGLKKAGYATNPNYPQLLITSIEKHNLHQYDLVKPGEQEQQEIKKEKEVFVEQRQLPALKELNGLPVILARKGDSYAKIALENDMMVWQIYKYNDLKRDAEPGEGDTLYLKPKRNKGSQAYYTVEFGDNMYSISQRFAIKLKSLYRKNKMNFGTEPMWGETLNLQKSRKTAPRLRSKDDEAMRPLLIPGQPKNPGDLPGEDKKPLPKAIPAVKDTVQKPVFTPVPEPQALPADTQKLKEELKAEQKSLLPVQASAGQQQPADTATSFIKEEQLVQEEDAKKNVEATAEMIQNMPVEKRADTGVDNATETFLHTVQPKETMYSIARKYNLKVAQLKDINKLSSDTLRIGQQLIVNQHQAEGNRSDMLRTGVHIVSEKETLFGIARMYKLSVDDLIALNQLKDLNVRVGQELVVIKNPRPEPKEELKKEEPLYHTVQNKETLYSISRKYSVTVEELMKLNSMTDFSLKTGQRLRVR